MLPPGARLVVSLFAMPGIVLLVLSILLGFVSIFVLLLLTVPVYRVMRAIFGDREPAVAASGNQNPFVSTLFGQMASGWDNTAVSPGRKHVDARVIDAE